MKIDGIQKLLALGIPEEELWAMVPGVTAIDVKRWKDLKAAQPPEPPISPAVP